MGNIKILAHRGGLLNAAENTIEAFKFAFENGADGIECDVRVSKDGNFVLVHDEDFKRIAGCKKKVCEMAFKEIREIKVFGREPVACLDDLLGLLIKYPEKECYLEICFKDKNKLMELIRKVKQLNLLNRIYFLFFSNSSLLKERNEYKDIKLSIMPLLPLNIVRTAQNFAAASICLGWVNIFSLKKLFICLSDLIGIKEQIEIATTSGIFVSGGVANTISEFNFFKDLGVGGIWTDDVLLLKTYLNQNGDRNSKLFNPT